MIDLAAITIATYNRLRTDAAGAALRVALGAGAASVLHAEDLRLEGLNVLSLPARPLVALRRGSVPQSDRVVFSPLYTWFIYDDIAQGYGRIEQLPAMIAQAFEPLLVIGTTAVGAQEIGSVGAQTRDGQLGMLVTTVQLIIGAV